MKLSIIVPIYKIEKYLPYCVESVLSQSYKNYELILVDDGSPDNCGKICDEYASKNPHVKVIHKPNGGLSSARNAGMEIAEGEYLFFLDGDDFLEEESLAKLMEAILDKDADMYTFANYNYNEKGEKKLVTNISNKYFYSINDLYKEIIEEVGYFRWEVWRYLYKRSIVEENNLKARIEAKITEDCDFTNKYFQHVKSIYSVNIPVVNYRIFRVGSAMSQKDKEKAFDEIRNGKEHYEFYKNLNNMKYVVNYFEKYYYRVLKKLILQFEIKIEDEEILKKYRIKPNNIYGKIFELCITKFGYKNFRVILKYLKKINGKRERAFEWLKKI